MMIALAAALLLQADAAGADLTARCEINYTVARTAEGQMYSDDLTADCETAEDAAGAEAEALRQAYWERDYDERRGAFIGAQGRVTLELTGERTANGIEWWGYSQPLLRVAPAYPRSAARAGATATCYVRYHLRGGYSRVLGSTCNAEDREESFGIASRNAVRQWIFSSGRDVDCAVHGLAFRLDENEAEPDWPEAPPCESED
ncbi:MAG: hypothetical protein GC188_12410 [Alphaproteobacteria bacterium]|nr:hypothetical protein [Alphaproteobacteria bacterium]